MKTKNAAGIVIKLLWIAAILVGIKTVFTDFGADNAYTMAMSYRHISGDRMFLEMWEPHQTSIFFVDALMAVYGLFVPSYTGAAIFLQLCGTAFYCVVAWLLFKEIKELAGKIPAHFAAVFFLVFRVKQSVFPEYANLQIAFSALMFLFLYNFFKEQKKTFRLVLAALFLCLEVLSYPSCAVALVASVVLICIYSDRKVRNSLVFVGTTAVAGILYVLYFALKIGPALFLECIRGIMSADLHTNVEFIDGTSYYRGFVLALIWIAVAAAITAAACVVWKFVLKKEFNAPAVFGGVFFAINAVMIVFGHKIEIDWTCCFYIVPAILIVLGVLGYKEASADTRRFFVCGMTVSLASMLAAAMLTNLGIITQLAYLVLGGTVSFAVIKNVREKAFAGIALILVTVLFNRGIVVWGYGNQWNVWKVYEVERYVKGGPTALLVTDYMTSKMTEVNAVEFGDFVRPGDKLLIVGDEWLFDPAVYMYAGAEISNWSVIDTPYYSEKMLDYYAINSDKEPTVVAVKCWFGNEKISGDSFIMKWVNAGYEPAGDGSYFRFYRKKTASN